MNRWRVVADVGGSNVRFATVDGSGLFSDVRTSPTRIFATFEDALTSFWTSLSTHDGSDGIAVGAAGPVTDGIVKLTNGAWTISEEATTRAVGGRRARVINDLEAVAYAVCALQPEDVEPIDGRIGPAPRDLPRLVVNVGTGFGGALAIAFGGSWRPVACEPGHMKIALPADLAVRVGKPSASVEDVLSGLALDTLWAAADDPGPAGRWLRFGELLGQVCGDLVLATGSWGGVYLCGSVASAWWGEGDRKAFTRAFLDKGPMRDRMSKVPVGLLTNPYIALKGLAAVPLA